MSEAKKLIEECKQILAEIKRLIRVLGSMSPEEILKRIKALPFKDKAVLVDMMRRGEISQQIMSVKEKNPTYIL